MIALQSPETRTMYPFISTPRRHVGRAVVLRSERERKRGHDKPISLSRSSKSAVGEDLVIREESANLRAPQKSLLRHEVDTERRSRSLERVDEPRDDVHLVAVVVAFHPAGDHHSRRELIASDGSKTPP